MQLYLDRYLTDLIVPGNRVTVVGIYSIRKTGGNPQKVSGKREGGGGTSESVCKGERGREEGEQVRVCAKEMEGGREGGTGE